MTLHITIAEDLSRLLDALAEAVDGPRPDPFTPELIVVPSAGMQRWVEQQLAQRLGVAANISFLLPGQLSAVLKAEAASTPDDAWRLESMTGHLFDIGNPHRPSDQGTLWDGPIGAAGVPGAERAAAAGPLGRAADASGSWMIRARYIADLFDRYGMYRPHMLRNWAIGQDLDGNSLPLPDGQRWQPQLWRQLKERLGDAPAETLDSFLRSVSEGAASSAIPQRAHVFRLRTMSREFMHLLVALGHSRELRIFTQTTSEMLARHLLLGVGEPAPASHPLLDAWGRPEREGLELMREIMPDAVAASDWLPVTRTEPSTRLGHIQHALATGSPAAGSLAAGSPATGSLATGEGAAAGADADDPEASSEPPDTSVQFHGCSGVTRQVEVLRDALLHLLADDPTLTEDDITVMCPRLDRFAPIIRAVWGTSAGHDEDVTDRGLPALRYRVNEPSLASSSPLIDAVIHLLRLLAGRATHSELATFLTRAPVRERFGLLDDFDHSTVVEWLERTALRWGLNAEHRSAHSQLPEDFTAHTVRQSADALVGSMALHEGEIVPDGPTAIRLDLSQFDLAARIADIAEILQALEGDWARSAPVPIAEWISRVDAAAWALFAVPDDESWQRTKLDDLLAALAPLGPNNAPLSLADFTEAFVDAISTRRGRRWFGSGAIVVDDAQALRSIPHRVIAILGFDEDAIPRPVATSDDLIAAAPHLGDRDRRLDAKQQLLEAVTAAADHVVVTFTNHNIHTNATVPPSVALQELLGAVHAVAPPSVPGPSSRGGDIGGPADLIRGHSRYAHTAANFTAADGEQPWSFDEVALRVQEATRTRGRARRLALPAAFDRAHHHVVSVDEMYLAITNPIGLYLRDTLGVRHRPTRRLPSDVLPVDVDPLTRWELGSELLERSLRGDDYDDWFREKQAAGQIAPGAIGVSQGHGLAEVTTQMLAVLSQRLNAPIEDLAVALETRQEMIRQTITVPTGETEIIGAIDRSESGIIDVTYSTRRSPAELRVWLHLLLLHRAGTPVPGVIVSRVSNRPPAVFPVAIHEDRDDAVDAALMWIIELHQRARAEVVPLFRRTSAHLAQANDPERSASALTKGRKDWYELSDRLGPMGDRARSDVATFFDGVDFDTLLDPLLGATRVAEELWSHVAATCAVWGDNV